MANPALEPPVAASQELTPETVLMRQFLFWATGYAVGMGLMVLGLWLLFRTLTSVIMLCVVVVVLPSFGYAYRLAGRNRVDPALLLVSSMIWVIALVPAAVRSGDLLVAGRSRVRGPRQRRRFRRWHPG